MWNPTHVQVTVQRARLHVGSILDSELFVTIALGGGQGGGQNHHGDKYQTSSRKPEKDIEQQGDDKNVVEWHEVCELEIPEWRRGGCPELELCVRKRRANSSFMGGLVPPSDKAVGRTVVPLDDADVYERPKSKWYQLHTKNNRGDIVGELQAKIAYTVKASTGTNLNKKEKHRLSVGHLSSSSSISGSLLSLGSSGGKGRSFKRLAKSITGKIKREKNISSLEEVKAEPLGKQLQRTELAVESSDGDDVDNDDFTLDGGGGEDFSSYPKATGGSSWSLENTGKKSTAASSVERSSSGVSKKSVSIERSASGTSERVENDEWQRKLYGSSGRDNGSVTPATKSLGSGIITDPVKSLSSVDKQLAGTASDILIISDRTNSPSTPPPRSPSSNKRSPSRSPRIGSKWSGAVKRVVVGMEQHNKGSVDGRASGGGEFDGKSKDDLIAMVMELRRRLTDESRRREDLEDYVDALLARVMDRAPNVLQRPFETTSCRRQVR